MPTTYQEIYPSDPLLRSYDRVRPSATTLLSLEYFEADHESMPNQVIDQHDIMIYLKDEPLRVENWRDGQYRDFTYHKHEIIVTPAGIASGWRWHTRSKVIVITLDPDKLEAFAQTELGILLTGRQLQNVPQFIDEDITQAGRQLLDALQADTLGSDVIFESLARIFLVKLIQKYGLEWDEDLEFSKSFTAKHYKQVLDYVATHFGSNITLEAMATVANLSPYHFSRLFKQTLGQSPYQFVMSYRVEQAKKLLIDPNRPMINVAMSCGFSDQSHFSRIFKQIEGQTPKAWRKAR